MVFPVSKDGLGFPLSQISCSGWLKIAVVIAGVAVSFFYLMQRRTGATNIGEDKRKPVDLSQPVKEPLINEQEVAIESFFKDWDKQKQELKERCLSGNSTDSPVLRWDTFSSNVASYCKSIMETGKYEGDDILCLSKLSEFLSQCISSNNYYFAQASQQLYLLVSKTSVAFARSIVRIILQIDDLISKLPKPDLSVESGQQRHEVVSKEKLYEKKELDFNTVLAYLAGEEGVEKRVGSMDGDACLQVLWTSDHLGVERLKLICQKRLCQLLKEKKLGGLEKEPFQEPAPYLYQALVLLEKYSSP